MGDIHRCGHCGRILIDRAFRFCGSLCRDEHDGRAPWRRLLAGLLGW